MVDKTRFSHNAFDSNLRRFATRAGYRQRIPGLESNPANAEPRELENFYIQLILHLLRPPTERLCLINVCAQFLWFALHFFSLYIVGGYVLMACTDTINLAYSRIVTNHWPPTFQFLFGKSRELNGFCIQLILRLPRPPIKRLCLVNVCEQF